MSPGQVPVIVLAAGGSTRSRKPKQQMLYNGKPLLRHALEVALGSGCRPVYAVLGARARVYSRQITDLQVSVSINEGWEEGIGSSIRTGLRSALIDNDNLEALLFMVVDQPLVTSRILDGLAETHKRENPHVTACSYHDGLGIPALFDRSLFGALEDLRGDEGAKKIILLHRENVVAFECPEAGIDIDTEDDLESLEPVRETDDSEGFAGAGGPGG